MDVRFQRIVVMVLEFIVEILKHHAYRVIAFNLSRVFTHVLLCPLSIGFVDQSSIKRMIP